MRFSITISHGTSGEKITLTPEEVSYAEYDFEQLNSSSLANMTSKVEMKISGKLLSNLDESGSNDLTLYEKNREDVKKICEWAFDYKKETDYRNVDLEVELGDGEKYFYSFRNMFAVKLQQSFSTNYGVSTFVLTLKQKYFEDMKVSIEY